MKLGIGRIQLRTRVARSSHAWIARTMLARSIVARASVLFSGGLRAF